MLDFSTVKNLFFVNVERLVGTSELAGWLGVPVASIYALNRRPDGPSRYRIGKLVKYRPSEVATWIDGQAVLQGPARGSAGDMFQMTVGPMVTVEELAEWLGIPVKTVFWFNTSLTGPTRYRVGRRVKYKSAEVPGWIEARACRIPSHEGMIGAG